MFGDCIPFCCELVNRLTEEHRVPIPNYYQRFRNLVVFSDSSSEYLRENVIANEGLSIHFANTITMYPYILVILLVFLFCASGHCFHQDLVPYHTGATIPYHTIPERFQLPENFQLTLHPSSCSLPTILVSNFVHL